MNMFTGDNNHKIPNWKWANYQGKGKAGKDFVKLWTLKQNVNSFKEYDKSLLHHIMMAMNAMETRHSFTGSSSFGDQQDKIFESQLREEQVRHSTFTVGQFVRMLDDEPTFKAMQPNLGNKLTHLMAGQVGYVSKVDDGQNIFLEFLDTSLPVLTTPVQSEWIKSLPVSVSQRYETLFKLKWKQSDLLVEAAKEGDLFLVQLLIHNYKIPADVLHRSTPGLTALHVACLEGHVNVIQWFLSEPRNKDLLLEKEDYKGRRAIHFAVKARQYEALNMLIKNGAEIDPQTRRRRLTSLHKAVIKLDLKCVIILIENYCNVNLQDSEGNTPLHHSVSATSSQDSDDVFKALVKSGRIYFKIRNVKGYTVFLLAVLAGNLSAVRFLLESEKGEMHLEKLTETGSNALHLACIKGYLQIAKLLMDPSYGLINESNNCGQTPLMVACLKGFSHLIELLVKTGANVNVTDENCNSAISFMMRRIYLVDLHESDTKKTNFPISMEESPEIYEIFIELVGLPCYKETMERHPSIAFVCFLLRHGGDLASGRHWISKVRDVNVKAILKGFSSGWKMSVDEEQLVVICILCDKPASRMRFVCCGNESCMLCFVCRTEKILRCPCCNSSIKPNNSSFPINVLDDDSVTSDPYSEPDNDSDSSLVNHQPSFPKDDGNNHIQQSTDVSTAISSYSSLLNEAFKRPAGLPPIIQIDNASLSSEDSISMPVVTCISSPLPSNPGGPLRNPKWILRKRASRKGTDLLEDDLGNCYTRRSSKVWQCTRQSDKQKNKCPATVRIVGGEYTVSKSHRHSTQSATIARSYCNTYQILD